MLRILNKIRKIGIITEAQPHTDDLEELGIQVKRHVDRQFRGSLALRAVDAGSCNGCELEIHHLGDGVAA